MFVHVQVGSHCRLRGSICFVKMLITESVVCQMWDAMFHPISRTDRAGIGLKCGVFHIAASQTIINSLEKASKFKLVTKLCGNLSAFIGYSSFIFIGVSCINIIENRVSVRWTLGVLTINNWKPEIPVGKSNGSRHSVLEDSESSGCNLWQCDFSTPWSLFSWFGYTL